MCGDESILVEVPVSTIGIAPCPLLRTWASWSMQRVRHWYRNRVGNDDVRIFGEAPKGWELERKDSMLGKVVPVGAFCFDSSCLYILYWFHVKISSRTSQPGGGHHSTCSVDEHLEVLCITSELLQVATNRYILTFETNGKKTQSPSPPLHP